MDEFVFHQQFSNVSKPRILVIGENSYELTRVVHSILSCTCHIPETHTGWNELYAFQAKGALKSEIVRKAHYDPNIVHDMGGTAQTEDVSAFVTKLQRQQTAARVLVLKIIGIQVLADLIMQYIQSRLGVFYEIKDPILCIPWPRNDLHFTLFHVAIPTRNSRRQRRVNKFLNDHRYWKAGRLPGQLTSTQPFDFVFIDRQCFETHTMLKSIGIWIPPPPYDTYNIKSDSWVVYVAAKQSFYQLDPGR